MGFIALFVLAVGLAMDAFAVAVCKGLAMKEINKKDMVLIGLWFGGFQALMPIAGYFLGSRFQSSISAIDHWIAFGLLALIGVNMIKEAYSGEEECADPSLSFKTMFLLAVATSIDALVVGVTLGFLQADIVKAAGVIGIVTFALSVFGVKIGSIFGTKYKKGAEFAGGVILILLGVKVLQEHLNLF